MLIVSLFYWLSQPETRCNNLCWFPMYFFAIWSDDKWRKRRRFLYVRSRLSSGRVNSPQYLLSANDVAIGNVSTGIYLCTGALWCHFLSGCLLPCSFWLEVHPLEQRHTLLESEAHPWETYTPTPEADTLPSTGMVLDLLECILIIISLFSTRYFYQISSLVS